MQDNVKRLLAYSSIAHAGYLLMAFAIWPQSDPKAGISAAMFYTAAYAAMNVGAFAVVGHFAGAGERYVTLEDYSGLAKRSPALAAIFTIFLLSLIGIPAFGGFFAKFYVFASAVKQNLIGLLLIGVVNSAIAAYYYLRLIVVMYMKEGDDSVQIVPVPVAVAASLLIAAGLTLYLGIMPGSAAIDWNTVVFSALTIKGIYGREMYETWYKMTVMLQSGLDISPVITHHFHMTEFEKAFEIMRTGQSGKVILHWSDGG